MNSAAAVEPTHVACLTPEGTGAIATLAIRGPRAWSVLRELFSPGPAPGKQLPAEGEPGKFWLGRLREGLGGKAADDVVLAVKRVSPVPWLEMHCHGGREVIRYLLEIFAAHGMQICSWQDLERLTTNRPGQAAALMALTEARTTRTAAILLDQYHGAFARAIQGVEAALDDEDFAEAETILATLVQYSDVGRHLTAPWQVVVAGAPNVGKSSLVNALAGYQRSVVAATPGTTRDVVTTVIAIEGWLVELADTAGLRQDATALEQMGMEKAHHAVEDADLCLWVLDSSACPVCPAWTSPSPRFVVNKIDLPPFPAFAAPPGAVAVSAKTGAGLEELCQILAQWLVPRPPPPGAGVPFTDSLCERVEAIQHCVTTGQIGEARQLLQTLWE